MVEAASRGVPMIALPRSDDHPGMGARIELAGVGLRASFGELHVPGIAEAGRARARGAGVPPTGTQPPTGDAGSRRHAAGGRDRRRGSADASSPSGDARAKSASGNYLPDPNVSGTLRVPHLRRRHTECAEYSSAGFPVRDTHGRSRSLKSPGNAAQEAWYVSSSGART